MDYVSKPFGLEIVLIDPKVILLRKLQNRCLVKDGRSNETLGKIKADF